MEAAIKTGHVGVVHQVLADRLRSPRSTPLYPQASRIGIRPPRFSGARQPNTDASHPCAFSPGVTGCSRTDFRSSAPNSLRKTGLLGGRERKSNSSPQNVPPPMSKSSSAWRRRSAPASAAAGTGDGLGVAVGRGVVVGAGVAVGSGVADGTAVAVGVSAVQWRCRGRRIVPACRKQNGGYQARQPDQGCHGG